MADDITPELVTEVTNNAHGNLERTRELIEAHPGLLNAKSAVDETPIQAATQLANLPIIEYLLQKGAPADFFTNAVLGRIDEIRRELAANPDRARDRGVHGLPSLYFAAIGGHLEVAQLLVENGADVNEAAPAAAPIHGAVMGHNAAAMVAWLLERGADPSLVNFSGKTARQLAEQMKRPEVASVIRS